MFKSGTLISKSEKNSTKMIFFYTFEYLRTVDIVLCRAIKYVIQIDCKK